MAQNRFVAVFRSRASEQHHGRKRTHIGGYGIGAGQRHAGSLIFESDLGRLVGKGRLGRLGTVGGRRFGSAARSVERERKRAQPLLPLAHQLLPISRATAGKLRGGLTQTQVYAVAWSDEL